MLRKCLVALMMGVICAGNASAEQPAAKGSNPAPTGIVGWFKSRTSGKKSSTAKSTTTKSSAAKSTTAKSSTAVAKTKPEGAAEKTSTAKSVAASKVTSPPATVAPSRNTASAQSTASTDKPGSTAPKLTLSKRTKRTTSESTAAVERAMVRDAERQSVQVRQTAAQPDDSAPAELTITPMEPPVSSARSALVPVEVPAIPEESAPTFTAESALQPVPIQQAPVLPNTESTTGPQYFSATPAGMSNPVPVHPSQNWQQYQAPQAIHMTSPGQYWNASNYSATGPVYQGAAPMSVQNGMYPQSGSGMYPQTGAALYPAPRPGIPQQVGGIAIENQAFHPHEMLHEHRYRAIYPPYYYKVNGGWMVTPFGVWSREDWKLQGTQVDVKYHSSISPFTLFKPPVIR